VQAAVPTMKGILHSVKRTNILHRPGYGRPRWEIDLKKFFYRFSVCRYTSLVSRNFIRFGKRNGGDVGDIIHEGRVNKKD
jgi:hypothetical protein